MMVASFTLLGPFSVRGVDFQGDRFFLCCALIPLAHAVKVKDDANGLSEVDAQVIHLRLELAGLLGRKASLADEHELVYL